MNISIAKVFVRQQPNIIRSIMPAVKTKSALLPQLVDNTLLRASSSKLLRKTVKTKLGKLFTPLSLSAKEKIENSLQKATKKEGFVTKLFDFIKPQKYFSAEYLQNKNTSVVKNFAEHAEKAESSGFLTKIRQMFQKKQKIKPDNLIKEFTSEEEKNVIEKGQKILKKQKIKNKKKIKKVSKKKFTKINKKSAQISNTPKEVDKKSFKLEQTSSRKTQEPMSKSVEAAPKQGLQKDAVKGLEKENLTHKQPAENSFKPTGKKPTLSTTTLNKHYNGKNNASKFKNNQEIAPQKNIVSEYSHQTKVNKNSKMGNHNGTTNPFASNATREKVPGSRYTKQNYSCADENNVTRPKTHAAPHGMSGGLSPNSNMPRPHSENFDLPHPDNSIQNPTTADIKPNFSGTPNIQNADTNTFGHMTLSPELREHKLTDTGFSIADEKLSTNTTTYIKDLQATNGKTARTSKRNKSDATQDSDIIESIQQNDNKKSHRRIKIKIKNKKYRVSPKSAKRHKSQLIAEKFNQTSLQSDKVMNNSLSTEATKVLESESFAMYENEYGADAFSKYAEKHGLENALLDVLNNSRDVTDASLKTALDKFKKNPHLQEKILRNAKVGEFTKLLELASDSTLLKLKGTTFSNIYQTKLLRERINNIEHKFKQCG